MLAGSSAQKIAAAAADSVRLFYTGEFEAEYFSWP